MGGGADVPDDRSGQLSGIRVLDLSRVLAGPYCTALLADVGADVIKVETPGRGDDARSLGPFRDGESVYFAMLNRSKRSVTLNLRSDEGRALLHRLASVSDVLVENFRPGVTGRLGVDYETLRAVNPRLVYVSISGYGQDGPDAHQAAYDLTIQAASGLMNITGFPDGPPTRVGESLADLWAGMCAAWATTTALVERERTGAGTFVDVAMYDALLALQVTALAQYQVTGTPPGRVGNRHPVSTPFDSYRARDGLVVIAVANDALFARLAGLIGCPGLADDPRFASDDRRTAHESELRELIERWTSTRSAEEVVAAATGAGVPASAIRDLGEALHSEQSSRRRVLSSFEHPVAGRVDVVQQPVKFGGRCSPPPGPSPVLGEHTDEVLRTLVGLTPEQLAHARGAGAV